MVYGAWPGEHMNPNTMEGDKHCITAPPFTLTELQRMQHAALLAKEANVALFSNATLDNFCRINRQTRSHPAQLYALLFLHPPLPTPQVPATDIVCSGSLATNTCRHHLEVLATRMHTLLVRLWGSIRFA